MDLCVLQIIDKECHLITYSPIEARVATRKATDREELIRLEYGRTEYIIHAPRWRHYDIRVNSC